MIGNKIKTEVNTNAELNIESAVQDVVKLQRRIMYFNAIISGLASVLWLGLLGAVLFGVIRFIIAYT